MTTTSSTAATAQTSALVAARAVTSASRTRARSTKVIESCACLETKGKRRSDFAIIVPSFFLAFVYAFIGYRAAVLYLQRYDAISDNARQPLAYTLFSLQTATIGSEPGTNTTPTVITRTSAPPWRAQISAESPVTARPSASGQSKANVAVFHCVYGSPRHCHNSSSRRRYPGI